MSVLGSSPASLHRMGWRNFILFCLLFALVFSETWPCCVSCCLQLRSRELKWRIFPFSLQLLSPAPIMPTYSYCEHSKAWASLRGSLEPAEYREKSFLVFTVGRITSTCLDIVCNKIFSCHVSVLVIVNDITTAVASNPLHLSVPRMGYGGSSLKWRFQN